MMLPMQLMVVIERVKLMVMVVVTVMVRTAMVTTTMTIPSPFLLVSKVFSRFFFFFASPEDKFHDSYYIMVTCQNTYLKRLECHFCVISSRKMLERRGQRRRQNTNYHSPTRHSSFLEVIYIPVTLLSLGSSPRW